MSFFRQFRRCCTTGSSCCPGADDTTFVPARPAPQPVGVSRFDTSLDPIPARGSAASSNTRRSVERSPHKLRNLTSEKEVKESTTARELRQTPSRAKCSPFQASKVEKRSAEYPKGQAPSSLNTSSHLSYVSSKEAHTDVLTPHSFYHVPIPAPETVPPHQHDTAAPVNPITTSQVCTTAELPSRTISLVPLASRHTVSTTPARYSAVSPKANGAGQGVTISESKNMDMKGSAMETNDGHGETGSSSTQQLPVLGASRLSFPSIADLSLDTLNKDIDDATKISNVRAVCVRLVQYFAKHVVSEKGFQVYTTCSANASNSSTLATFKMNPELTVCYVTHPGSDATNSTHILSPVSFPVHSIADITAHSSKVSSDSEALDSARFLLDDGITHVFTFVDHATVLCPIFIMAMGILCKTKRRDAQADTLMQPRPLESVSITTVNTDQPTRLDQSTTIASPKLVFPKIVPQPPESVSPTSQRPFLAASSEELRIQHEQALKLQAERKRQIYKKSPLAEALRNAGQLPQATK